MPSSALTVEHMSKEDSIAKFELQETHQINAKSFEKISNFK